MVRINSKSSQLTPLHKTYIDSDRVWIERSWNRGCDMKGAWSPFELTFDQKTLYNNRDKTNNIETN